MEYQAISRDDTSFQRPLELTDIQVVCEHIFGNLEQIAQVTELGSGMFNNTYLVTQSDGARVILRVGPAESVYAFSNEKLLLRREQSMEPHLKVIEHLIPQTLFVDFSREIISRDYVVQTFLEGHLWDEVKDELSPAQIENLWEQMGAIAQMIHAVSGQTFGFPEPLPRFTTWADAVIAIASDMHADLHVLNLDASGVPEYIELLDQGRSLLNEISTPCLLHGDLWQKNVLLDDSYTKIVGLLDAERAFWGDPEAEWVFHYLEDMHPMFWQGYGQKFTESFRTHAYLGLYSVQLLLEAWRFGWDNDFIQQNLAKATAGMQKFI